MRCELCENCPDEYICRQAENPFCNCSFITKKED